MSDCALPEHWLPVPKSAYDYEGYLLALRSRTPEGVFIRDFVRVDPSAMSDFIRSQTDFISTSTATQLFLLLASVGGELIATPTEIRRAFGLSEKKWDFVWDNLRSHFLYDGHKFTMPDPPICGRNLWGVYYRRPPIPTALRQEVISRDKGICSYCGCSPEVPHIDHIIPVSRGGGSTLKNLCVACPPCNLSKGGKLLSEWEGKNV